MARQRENTGFQDTYWSKPNKKLMRFLSNMIGSMVTTSRSWEYKHPSYALGVWQGVNARPGDRWGAHLWGGFT